MKYDVGGIDQISFIPEIDHCCGERMTGGTRSVNEVWTITTQGLMPFRAGSWQLTCKQCTKIHYFDGRKVGIVNFENRYMIDIGNIDI